MPDSHPGPYDRMTWPGWPSFPNYEPPDYADCNPPQPSREDRELVDTEEVTFTKAEATLLVELATEAVSTTTAPATTRLNPVRGFLDAIQERIDNA